MHPRGKRTAWRYGFRWRGLTAKNSRVCKAIESRPVDVGRIGQSASAICVHVCVHLFAAELPNCLCSNLCLCHSLYCYERTTLSVGVFHSKITSQVSLFASQSSRTCLPDCICACNYVYACPVFVIPSRRVLVRASMCAWTQVAWTGTWACQATSTKSIPPVSVQSIVYTLFCSYGPRSPHPFPS